MKIKLASVSESTGGGDITVDVSLAKIEVRGWSEREGDEIHLLEYLVSLLNLHHTLLWL